jgi:hypothetical protein
VVHARPERDLVAEHLRELERLAGADGGEQRDPVGLGPLRLAQAEVPREPNRDQAGAKDVLHRLPEPEVR